MRTEWQFFHTATQKKKKGRKKPKGMFSDFKNDPLKAQLL